jgi:methionyl-tRNA formyltransferase
MKLVLFADGPVGSAIYNWLVNNWRADIAMVVTTGDNEISRSARDHGLANCHFVSTEQTLLEFDKLGLTYELGLLAWWPKIVQPKILESAKHGFINTHPSLLPYNRGKHYNFWAIVEESPFGVTLHRVDAGVDTGEIVAQQAIAYGWLDTGQSLYEKASVAMVELFKSTYELIRTLDFPSHPQPNGVGSFHRAKELDAASEIHLDQTYTGRQLVNLLRARTFPPHPACWFRDGEETYELRVTIGSKIERA